jgi:hypothetical protein
MALINKTGISNGGTIEAEHITRVIDALSGVSTDTLILSGSMTGSLIGTLTGTASFATSASRAVSSSFATTASYALNAAGSGFPFVGTAVITGSLTVSGSNNDVILRTRNISISGSDVVSVTGGTVNLSGTNAVTINGSASTTSWVADKYSIIDWTRAGETGYNGQFVLPVQAPTNPVAGTIYFDTNTRSLFVFDGDSTWKEFQPIP